MTAPATEKPRVGGSMTPLATIVLQSLMQILHALVDFREYWTSKPSTHALRVLGKR